MRYDYLIIGQGIAGTVLDFLLTKSGASVHVIDNAHVGAASSVAAGVVNPLTGRKYVKSWLIDDLVPEIISTYNELEGLLGQQLYRRTSVLRALHNIKEENEWEIKSGLKDNLAYCCNESDLSEYRDFLKIKVAYGELHGFQVFLPIIIRAYADYLRGKKRLTIDNFDFNCLETNETGYSYKGIQTKKIVFAEGYRAKHNPFFSHLAMEPAKGEALIIKINEVEEKAYSKILKHKLTFVPMGNRHFWVGSGYEWDYTDDVPSRVERDKMIAILDRVLTHEYEVVDHIAAIRPTVLDRRPFIGPHYEKGNMFIFNGFGTKGASLVPYWAKHFVNYLEHNKALAEEVSPDRKS